MWAFVANQKLNILVLHVYYFVCAEGYVLPVDSVISNVVHTKSPSFLNCFYFVNMICLAISMLHLAKWVTWLVCLWKTLL